MYYLKTENSFDSAHFLKGYAGKCRNLHGHRWRVVVEIAADQLKDEGQTRGMLVDFSDLKNALKDICDDFDHSLIYEKGFPIHRVEVYETPNNLAAYEE